MAYDAAMSNEQPSRRKAHTVAAGWGFAEGTFFFLVPDIWLSWVALKNPRRSLRASVSTLAGALAGGAVVYAWGRRVDAETSRRLLLRIPAVTPKMIDLVESEMERGQHSMVLGPLRGIPYKIYARTTGEKNLSLSEFLAWSVPARLPRFVLVALGTRTAVYAGRKILGRPRPGLEKTIMIAGWIAFYTWYFTHTGFFTWKTAKKR